MSSKFRTVCPFQNITGPDLPMTAEAYLEKLYQKPNRINVAKNLSKAALLSLCARVFQKPVGQLTHRFKKDLAAELISNVRSVILQINFTNLIPLLSAKNWKTVQDSSPLLKLCQPREGIIKQLFWGNRFSRKFATTWQGSICPPRRLQHQSVLGNLVPEISKPMNGKRSVLSIFQ